MPELAFEEHRTAGVIARELGRLGIACRTGVGRTGVMADIQGGRPGPTLVVRGDMDALPIEEQTGLAFASENPGKMHGLRHTTCTVPPCWGWPPSWRGWRRRWPAASAWCSSPPRKCWAAPPP